MSYDIEGPGRKTRCLIALCIGAGIALVALYQPGHHHDVAKPASAIHNELVPGMVRGEDGQLHYCPPGAEDCPPRHAFKRDPQTYYDEWIERDRRHGLHWMDKEAQPRLAIQYPDDIAQVLRIMCHDQPKIAGKRPSCPPF